MRVRPARQANWPLLTSVLAQLVAVVVLLLVGLDALAVETTPIAVLCLVAILEHHVVAILVLVDLGHRAGAVALAGLPTGGACAHA